MNVRTAHFFVKDLLAAEQAGGNFIHKGIIFTSVVVSGTITRVENVSDGKVMMEFLIYTVDDGTKSINCVLCLEQVSDEGIDTEKIREDALMRPRHPLTKMIKWSTLSLEKLKNDDIRALKIGDNVELVGMLRQEKDLRCILVIEIKKLELRQKIDSFKKYFQFYNFVTASVRKKS